MKFFITILFLSFSINGFTSLYDLSLTSVVREKLGNISIDQTNLNTGLEGKALFKAGDREVSLNEVPLLNEIYTSIVKEVFQTYRGEEYCDLLYESSTGIKHNLKNFFSVSHQVVDEIFKRCKKSPFHPLGHGRMTKYSEYPRSYKIIFRDSNEDYGFSSWTTNSITATTYFFVSKETTLEEFVRAILHEWYISFDEIFGYRRSHLEMTFPELFLYGDHLQFNLSEQDKNKLNNGLKDTLSLIDNQYDYHLVYTLPLVHFSFLALRAKNYENLFLRHLNWFEVEENQKSCEEELKDLIEKLAPHQLSFLGYDLIKAASENENLDLALVEQALMPEAAEIKLLLNPVLETGLFFNHPNNLVTGKVSFCELFSVPYLGLTSSFINRGPKPRTTGGWLVKDPEKEKEVVFKKKLEGKDRITKQKLRNIYKDSLREKKDLKSLESILGKRKTNQFVDVAIEEYLNNESF